MSTTDVRDAEITNYLDAVRSALSDLDPATRDGLVDDLPGHLAEVAANDPQPLAERLGLPSVFAEELRSAAGIAPPPGISPADPGQSTIDLMRAIDEAIGRMLGYDRARDWLAELQPAWWIGRGVIVGFLVFGLFGNVIILPVFAVVAIILSTRLGRRAKVATTPGLRVVSLLFSAVCTVILVLGFLVVLADG